MPLTTKCQAGAAYVSSFVKQVGTNLTCSLIRQSQGFHILHMDVFDGGPAGIDLPSFANAALPSC